jgi:hypothetical protein
VDNKGKLTALSLENIPFAKATLPNAHGPEALDRRKQPMRQSSITQIGYVDGRVFVAGLSNEEWSSTLRAIPFPFTGADKGASIGIFHGAHGRFETDAPVRTFAPYQINGQAHLLAAYTCTPLVKLPVAELKPGARVKGTTVAELGNRNNPLDMIIYQKGGKDYLLMANTSRGMMKIDLGKVATIEGITARPQSETAGLPYETIQSIKGVAQMARLGQDQALVLVRADDGAMNLQTVAMP